MTFLNERQVNHRSGEVFHQKHRLGSMAVGIFAAALAADGGVMALEKQSSNSQAGLTTKPGSETQSVIVLPGCRTDGAHIADMMAPQLASVGRSYFLSYPRRGFDLDSIKDRLLEARHDQAAAPVSVLALSMGGITLSLALRDPEFRRQFGPIDRLVLDSSPHDLEDVRGRARVAMSAAALLQTSWAASSISAKMMQCTTKKQVGHEDCVTDAQVDEHYFRTNHTPLHQTKSQCDVIRKAHFADDELAGTVGELIYLQSPYDSVIATDQAVSKYEATYAQAAQTIIDTARPHGSHASSPEYQRRAVELVSLDHAVDTEAIPNGVQASWRLAVA